MTKGSRRASRRRSVTRTAAPASQRFTSKLVNSSPPKPGCERLPGGSNPPPSGASSADLRPRSGRHTRPSFGAETLKRGEAYTRYALGGLARLPEDEVYRALIDSGMRIRFYGDYEQALRVAGLRSALETCATLTDATASGEGPLLLIGLFADDPYPTIARLSVEYAGREGRPPGRAELIEAYYRLPVPDLSLYVGFAQPEMFDVPLLTNGLEHLYVTLNTAPDPTERQLREILYDHLVTRRAAPVDYATLSLAAQRHLAEYTERCKGDTLGIGRIDPLTGLWRPLLPTRDHYR